jgi:hypothetical protein
MIVWCCLVLCPPKPWQYRYFYSNACPEMPEPAQAEVTCRARVEQHRDLVEDVLRTPPFISCAAGEG